MSVIKDRNRYPISSDILKATISMAYRDKQYLTCTEFRFDPLGKGHRKDVIAIKEDELIEFEIKISKVDLVSDTKKKKHYKEPTVNKFYYVVPHNLLDDAVTVVKQINQKYGIISYVHPYKGNNSHGFHIHKSAILLRPKKMISRDIFELVYKRLSFENGRLLMKLAMYEISGKNMQT